MNTDKPDKTAQKQFRAVYAPIMVRSQNDQDWKPTLSLMDSGNTLSFCCISQTKHKELGLTLCPTNTTGQAAAKQKLSIIGVSETLEIRFASIEQNFYITPLVVQYLNSPLNLGAKFNFEHGIVPQKPMNCPDSPGGKANYMEYETM